VVDTGWWWEGALAPPLLRSVDTIIFINRNITGANLKDK